MFGTCVIERLYSEDLKYKIFVKDMPKNSVQAYREGNSNIGYSMIFDYDDLIIIKNKIRDKKFKDTNKLTRYIYNWRNLLNLDTLIKFKYRYSKEKELKIWFFRKNIYLVFKDYNSIYRYIEYLDLESKNFKEETFTLSETNKI